MFELNSSLRPVAIAAGFLSSLFTLAGCSDGGGELEREFEASFLRDIVETWYPVSLDAENGGFLTSLDAQWKPKPMESQDKFVVTQARHIWTLSQLAMFLGDTSYSEKAMEGADFFFSKMWDEEHGGFFQVVDQAGAEVVDENKSAYGMSFAIYGFASLYEATKNPRALEYAQKTFNWLEEHSWDSEYGGYADVMARDGSWRPQVIQGIDAPQIGAKDYNSSIHLLESLTVLYRVWPDELVRQRLEGMLELVRDRFTQEKGYLHLYFAQDWKPLSLKGLPREEIVSIYYSDHVSWGHDVETAVLMLEGSHELYGKADERTLAVAKKLVDHSLATGWDAENGGFLYGGYYFEGDQTCEVINRSKVWWVQAEGLTSLLLMAKLHPDEAVYQTRFNELWEYVKTRMLDPVNGGWLELGTDQAPDAASMPKAHVWKGPYHDGRTYINCLLLLRGEHPLLQH